MNSYGGGFDVPPEWHAAADAAAGQGSGGGGADNGMGIMRVRRASEMSGRARKRWLAKNRIPYAAVSLLVGDEGIGKSLLWVLGRRRRHHRRRLLGSQFGIPRRDPEHVLIAAVTEDDW